MNKTFYSFSFGCRVNEAEKIAMDTKLLSMGFFYDELDPQFYIINTCAVTGKAEREVRQHIYQTKKKFPNTIIVITGCSATLWNNQHVPMKDVDYIIPNTEKSTLPEFIHHLYLTQSSSQQYPSQSTDKLTLKRNFVGDKFLQSGRLMIKIQDGCNRFCSYCIVPSVRGLPKSRSIQDIIKEILSYGDSIQEVILTAINTEAFGKDTGETFIGLIDAILKETTIAHISFGSIHPWSITDVFIKYYQSIKNTGRFIPFFHIPLQSGSDTVLQRMNRQYKAQDVMEKMIKIKQMNPDAIIGTDIIVGFPGETEEEFKETYTMLKNAPIDKIHVFRYSPRPGTKANELKHVWKEVLPMEKIKRSKILRELSLKKAYHLKCANALFASAMR